VKEDISDDHILALLSSVATHERGFRLLMTRYQEPLYRHIRRMVYDHDDANDIIQNTFIKVFRSIERFEGKSKLYTWLYRIATNEAITFLNTRTRKETDTIDNAENTQLANQLRADTFFDGDEVQVKLQQAIAILPDKQRTVFNLRYYEEMPYEEMSEVLGTSVGALKASYHHAVKKVEEFFKGVELM
jgi:RNA polymerase sigma-70 factor (ECF subfamily)